MSILARLEDAQILYEYGRPEGALAMLLISVAAMSRKRYPRSKYRSDREAFTRFINDEVGTITGSVCNCSIRSLKLGFRGKQMSFADFLYEFLRNSLIHEAIRPDDIDLIRDSKVLFRIGKTASFNEVILQGLANAIHLAVEGRDAPPTPVPGDAQSDQPATVLGRVLQKPLDFRQVVTMSRAEVFGDMAGE